MLASTSSRVASASTRALPFVQSRAYAVSVKPSTLYDGKPVPRRYGQRKTHLYDAYTRLLQTSHDTPLVFLQHTNFSAQRLVKLRRDLAVATERHAKTTGTPAEAVAPPSITVLRNAIFGVALRDFAPIDTKKSEDIAHLLSGGLAVLSLPSLDPPQLQALLRALERSVPPVKQLTPEQREVERKAKAEAAAKAAIPGRRAKRVREEQTPELRLMGAFIEGKVFTTEGVKDVSKLPNLDTLRAQLVGLLSAPAAQLAAVLSQASGGQLARTLEGFKKALEEEGQSAEQAAS
jgi:ribosomal protein L10